MTMERRQIAVSLNGVRVKFEVPNTLKFVGEVSYRRAINSSSVVRSNSISWR